LTNFHNQQHQRYEKRSNYDASDTSFNRVLGFVKPNCKENFCNQKHNCQKRIRPRNFSWVNPTSIVHVFCQVDFTIVNNPQRWLITLIESKKDFLSGVKLFVVPNYLAKYFFRHPIYTKYRFSLIKCYDKGLHVLFSEGDFVTSK
jgi:hypothetical protein